MEENRDNLDAIRKRPGMYIGSTCQNGLLQLAREVCSNAIDQFVSGKSSKVRVSIDEDGSVEVEDDGDGFPFDQVHSNGANLGAHYLTALHKTNTADHHAPHIHFSYALGVGLSPVNALSRYFSCRSWRGGTLWAQTFEQGKCTSLPKVVKQGAGKGTVFRFTPDKKIFGEKKIPVHTLRQELLEASYLFPGLVLELNGEEFLSPKGLVHLTDQKKSTHLESQSVAIEHKDFHAQLAFAGELQNIEDTQWYLWANGASTNEGGSHLSGCLKGFSGAGIFPEVVALHVIMNSLEYAGPTRAKLDIPILEEAIAKELPVALRGL